jgi:hypothetical protein
METDYQPDQFGPLLWGQHRGDVHKRFDKLTRGSFHQLQFRPAEFLQGLPINDWLSERLKQSLVLCLVLFSQWQQIVHSPLHNRFYLLLLLLAGVDPMHDPVCGKP